MLHLLPDDLNLIIIFYYLRSYKNFLKITDDLLSCRIKDKMLLFQNIFN